MLQILNTVIAAQSVEQIEKDFSSPDSLSDDVSLLSSPVRIKIASIEAKLFNTVSKPENR